VYKALITASFVLAVILAPTTTGAETPANYARFPQAPDARTREDMMPARVIIPSIGLDAPIQNMGLNKKGELDVPSGKTNNVGWWAKGTLPGEVGSAVFDAHVFAAFSALKYLEPGADIYVVARDGEITHFVAQEATTYALSKVPATKLFAQNDQPRLNLITCAGSLTKDRSTYTHRLIVYATLAS